ncbi:hypothetical protein JKA74_00820 [Marivirga sp. S37H4]|uniref:Arsenate reductase n=1 Tax=Marivirga aurantiaca TaxID=2802615 RepID=A0A935C515_9BACT|nr:ArsC/Spx/MgsR family protein [Marivirga aurantiaca]MBK6263560.1 hypothetical protein [Marivirga aurantiaca]
MALNKKKHMEVRFIYNSNQIKERKTLAYIKSLDKHYINEVDIYKQTLTERQLAELAGKLNVHVGELLDEESEFYKDNLTDSQLETNDILVLIKNNPDILKTPIVEYGKSADFVGSAYDFNNIDLEFESNKDELSNRDEKDN